MATALLAIVASRALYADGAYFFYQILNAKGFFYNIPSRFMSYWAVQAPVAFGLKLGLSDIRLLDVLFNIGLVSVPPLLLIAAAWLARNSMVLLGGTAVIVAAVYYPPAMFHVGEFAYPYALSWLAFVALMLRTRHAAALALICSVMLLACYETALALGLLLALVALHQAYQAQDRATQLMLVAAAGFFALSAVISLYVVLHLAHPIDRGATQFTETLFDPARTYMTWGALGFALAAFAAALFLSGPARKLAAPILFLLGILLLLLSAGRQADAPAFGVPYDQRSAAFVALFVTICGAFVLKLTEKDFQPDLAGALIVVLPVILAAGIDARSTSGWSSYLDDFCTELLAASGKTPALEFHARQSSKQYGWNWTNPFQSVVMRPAGSQAVILNPSWQIDVPDIDPRYKTRGSLCQR